MTRCVALLRGINVGGARRVPMAELREVAVSCGLQNVSTYIASGNLLFDCDSPRDAQPLLSAAIAEHFGFAVDLLVVTAATLRDAVAACPYTGDPSKITLTFLAAPFDDAQRAALRSSVSGNERLELGTSSATVAFAEFGDGLAQSRLAQRLHSVSSTVTTTRNLRTARKLVTLL